ncbi:TSUP family transporter [Methylosinus sp. PW1]|uniref:TSUP family transporter n=1 Tax=Methylosinus sp. PW1 TaxID=107636 RepID=UPI000560398D|nr:TSUP family transporter [Methylosinus sp. PW1]
MSSRLFVIGAGCGAALGFTLGLIGGGSVLAVPLLVYMVGVKDPHVAIGASAFAVNVAGQLTIAFAIVAFVRRRPYAVQLADHDALECYRAK